MSGEGRTDHGYRDRTHGTGLRLANRVYCLRNASLTVPVGPFLCLPTMMSARFSFSGVGIVLLLPDR